MPNRSSIFNFSRRDPWLAFAIFIVTVVVLEACFAQIPGNSLEIRLRAGAMPPKSPDCQVMGDSVAEGGILAPELSACLNGDFVYNAALRATGPEFSYFILKRELAEGRAPRAILYSPSPHTFATKRVALLVGVYAQWGEIMEILKSRMEISEAVYGIFCKFSYTLRNREPLANRLRGINLSSWDRALDAAVPPPFADGKPLPRFTVEAPKKPFNMLPFNEYFLEKFLELAEAHHIPVYWFTMPVSRAVLESRKPFHFSAGYDAFLGDLQSRHHVILLQRDFLVYGDEFFIDGLHVNKAGAERVTELLAQEFLNEKKSSVKITGQAYAP